MAEKHVMIGSEHPKPSVQRQCKLIGFFQSSRHRETVEETEEYLELMRLIDEEYRNMSMEMRHTQIYRQTAFNSLINVSQKFIECFTLGSTSWYRGNLCPVSPFLCFMNNYFTMKTHKTMLKNQSVFSYSWVARIFWIRPCRFSFIQSAQFWRAVRQNTLLCQKPQTSSMSSIFGSSYLSMVASHSGISSLIVSFKTETSSLDTLPASYKY